LTTSVLTSLLDPSLRRNAIAARLDERD